MDYCTVVSGRYVGEASGFDNKTDVDQQISAQKLILNWADQNAMQRGEVRVRWGRRVDRRLAAALSRLVSICNENDIGGSRHINQRRPYRLR
jgi:hypothetical protein